MGLSLLETQRPSIRNQQTMDDAEAAYVKWHQYNVEMLRRMFDSEEYSNAYSRAGSGSISFSIERDFGREIQAHLDLFKSKLNYLDSLADRIDLIDLVPYMKSEELVSAKIGSDNRVAKVYSKTKVFLVHGQDAETKTVVARFIEHCGLEPIILHEQPDQGRTIIEKFEQISDVSFAVVLLTPDDVGETKPTSGVPGEGSRPRARQNVILELGYFIGKLGRKGVCALKKGDVELPSDFSGVVYTPYDGADEGWKIKLAREMRAAGLEVDLNKALG